MLYSVFKALIYLCNLPGKEVPPLSIFCPQQTAVNYMCLLKYLFQDTLWQLINSLSSLSQSVSH